MGWKRGKNGRGTVDALKLEVGRRRGRLRLRLREERFRGCGKGVRNDREG